VDFPPFGALKQSESEILKTINGNPIYYQDTRKIKFIYWYSENQLWTLVCESSEKFNKQDFINFAKNFYEKYPPTANIY